MHFCPYRVSPMSDATVADELTFASWTDEQKRIARAVLEGDIRKEIEAEGPEFCEDCDELKEELATLKDDIRRLADA